MNDEPIPIIVPDAAIDDYDAREAALALPWRKPAHDYPDDLPLSLVAFLDDL